jgi:hypothetical protein
MISKPTAAQLLQTIKTELSEKIAPALTDPTHAVAIGMIGAILDQLSVRSESEIAFMVEEIAAIETAAADYLSANPRAVEVADALTVLAQTKTTSLHLSHLLPSYNAASELLSVMGDAAYASGDQADIARVERLVEHRLGNEMTIVGSFIAVGRD